VHWEWLFVVVRRFKIETFATRLGVRAIAFAGSGLLLMNSLGAYRCSLAVANSKCSQDQQTSYEG